MKIKSFFETPKKAVLTSLCIVAALVILGTGTVFAAGAIAKSTAIGADKAQNFAFADAGVDPVSAQIDRTEFDFEQGQFVYEVEFTAGGTEYEYRIKASDGAIIKKEMKTVDAKGNAASVQITQEQAKEIALKDAGLAAADVTFTESKLDQDDQITVYEISFRTADTEYEYEINAVTGVIYSKSKEKTVKDNTQNQIDVPNKTPANQDSSRAQTNQNSSQTVNRISLETAKNKALSDAGVSSADATFTKAKLDYDDGIAVYDIEFYTKTHRYDYEINADTGKIISREVEGFQTDAGGNTGNGSTYIGIDKAKSIALSHAGLSDSAVTFAKAKLENDDGKTVYEIEFYHKGSEYEYSIEAVSGKILEYDHDRD